MAEIMTTGLSKGERYMYLETPVSKYSTFSQDEVLLDDQIVGISLYPVYSANTRGWISLATIEEELAVAGRELTVTWGEPNGGSNKGTVETHIQKSVRVTVDPKPTKRD